MASFMSAYLRSKVMNCIFQHSVFTGPGTVYFGLAVVSAYHTDNGTEFQSGVGGIGQEVSGTGYSRQSIPAFPSDLPDSPPGTITNNMAVSWSNVSWTATVVGCAILDSISNGTILFYGDLVEPKTVNVCDSFTISVDAMQVILQ